MVQAVREDTGPRCRNADEDVNNDDDDKNDDDSYKYC